MKKISYLFLFLLIGFVACNTEVKKDTTDPEVKDSTSTEQTGFVIKRGVNVSHWISQTEMRGEEREQYVTARDFKKIAELGFDHVRIPFDEMHLWDEEGNKIEEAFTLLHNAINWSFENNLRVIADLHVLRSHHFNRADNRKLWTDTVAQQKFWGFWKQLSAELIKYPTDSLAYELMNEAVADNPEDWNKLIGNGIKTIRENEPNRTIVVGSNRWQMVTTFKDLKVPENDTNIILSFHFYDPFIISHYKASWTGAIKDYDGEINYPGYSIDTTTAEYAKLGGDMLKRIKELNREFNQETMEKDIMLAVTVAEKLGLKLYCGEFGCFPTTPMKMRELIYKDYMAIFNKHNIAWSHWNYKNDFPLVDATTLEPITELTNILTKP